MKERHPGFYQFEAMGIMLWAEAFGENCVSTRIEGCIARGNEKHGIIVMPAQPRDNRVERCLVEDNNADGINIKGGGQRAVSVVGCTAHRNAGS